MTATLGDLMKQLTVANYRKDQLYPVVVRAVEELLKTRDFVAPVDLLLHTQRITPQQYEDWRMGRIPYLERVVVGNLSKLNRLLRLLRFHTHDLNLIPSQIVYHKWGRGRQRIVLRFSKSGEPNLEAAYSRHFVQLSAAPEFEARKAKLAAKAEKYAAKTAERARERKERHKEVPG